MDFFDSIAAQRVERDDDSEDEPERYRPEWLGPSPDVMGATLALDGVVYRSEHLFIGLPAAAAYPSGVTFTVTLAVRRGDWSREEWTERQDILFGYRHHGRGQASGAALKVGAELADGQRLSTSRLSALLHDHHEEPPSSVLAEHDGGGSGGSWSYSGSRELWLWPLPSGETFDLVFAWGAFDMPVTRHTVSVASLRAAATKAVGYWP